MLTKKKHDGKILLTSWEGGGAEGQVEQGKDRNLIQNIRLLSPQLGFQLECKGHELATLGVFGAIRHGLVFMVLYIQNN